MPWRDGHDRHRASPAACRALALTLALLLGAACAGAGPDAGALDGSGGGSAGGGSGGGSGGSGSGGADGQGDSPGENWRGVRPIGRVGRDDGKLSWSGSGFEANFSGGPPKIQLANLWGSNVVDISIDGGSPSKWQVVDGQPIPLGALDAAGHRVRVTRRTGPQLGELRLVSADGTLAPTSAPRRRIEVIGDSIACGYGIEGQSPCANSAAVENANRSFAQLAAGKVGAEASLVAVSGRGLTRNSVPTDALGAQPAMPRVWLRAGPNDPNSRYNFAATPEPDAVVVALGTNDFSYFGFDANGVGTPARDPLDVDAFSAGLGDFVDDIRSTYRDAQVFLCGSPMLNDQFPTTQQMQHATHLASLRQVAAAYEDGRVTVVDFPGMKVGPGLNGCENHPSAEIQSELADLLAAAIAKAMGW